MKIHKIWTSVYMKYPTIVKLKYDFDSYIVKRVMIILRNKSIIKMIYNSRIKHENWNAINNANS